MTVQIKQCRCHQDCWNLFYQGAIAVSHETMAVCNAIAVELEKPVEQRFYSEGAEVADTIRVIRGEVTQ